MSRYIWWIVMASGIALIPQIIGGLLIHIVNWEIKEMKMIVPVCHS